VAGAAAGGVPGLIAAGMFAFMTAWNDYLFAVILTSTTAAKTLPVVVAGFATDVTTERTLMRPAACSRSFRRCPGVSVPAVDCAGSHERCGQGLKAAPH